MFTSRRGLTLLEVLISVFIMAIGLMSLAALIPLGQTQVQDGVRADVASAVGRAAYRDLQVRGYLDASKWRNHMIAANSAYAYDMDRLEVTARPTNPPPFPTTGEIPEQYIPSGNPLDWGNSVCIDPLFISRAAMLAPGGVLANNWRGRKFPYELGNDPDPQATDADPDTIDGFGDYPNPPRMQRLNIDFSTDAAGQFAAADRIFTWQDDLIFNVPEDQGLRALVQPLKAGIIGSDGKFQGTPTPVDVRQAATGDYSWMFTITPDPSEVVQPTSGQRTYTVSTVVFHKRNLAPPADAIADREGLPPTERMLYADFHSSLGMGGGEVRLRLPAHAGDNDKANQPENSDFPNIRPGQWIMLCAWTPGPDNTAAAQSDYFVQASAALPYGAAEQTRAVFRWYKVVGVADGPNFQAEYEVSPPDVAPMWFRDVTLVGPDWKLFDQPNTSAPNLYWSFVDADDDTPNTMPVIYGAPTVWAAVIDGVVGVYEKTITLGPQS
jgi:prepilin-type N-terminal cleavage/methylation domain-containing protein